MTVFFRVATLAALCVALLVLGGCAKPTPVGKWNGEIAVPIPGGASGGAKLTTTIEFKPDGTLAQQTKTPLGEMSATGTFKVEDDKVNIQVQNIAFGGRQVPVPAGQGEQNATFKIEGDKMTMTREGKSMEFTRAKEQ